MTGLFDPTIGNVIIPIFDNLKSWSDDASRRGIISMAAGGHKAAGRSWHLNAFDGNAVIFSLSIFSQGQSLIESESEK